MIQVLEGTISALRGLFGTCMSVPIPTLHAFKACSAALTL